MGVPGKRLLVESERDDEDRSVSNPAGMGQSSEVDGRSLGQGGEIAGFTEVATGGAGLHLEPERLLGIEWQGRGWRQFGEEPGRVVVAILLVDLVPEIQGYVVGTQDEVASRADAADRLAGAVGEPHFAQGVQAGRGESGLQDRLDLALGKAVHPADLLSEIEFLARRAHRRDRGIGHGRGGNGREGRVAHSLAMSSTLRASWLLNSPERRRRP